MNKEKKLKSRRDDIVTVHFYLFVKYFYKSYLEFDLVLAPFGAAYLPAARRKEGL
jgi:hypothetical protein